MISNGVTRLCPIPISSVRISDSFWSPRLELWRTLTLNDVLDKFDQEGAFDNFDRVSEGLTEGHKGMPWYDGLIYETIRAAADFLASQPDLELERRIDALICRIARAASADPDGYVNTFTTLMRPTQRWGLNGGNAIWQHDLYNAGALVEAAVHYYQATGKTELLKVATKFANYICSIIGPSPKMNMVPEHAMPEEAFVELYRLYRDNPSLIEKVGLPVDAGSYLKQTEFWIEARGNYEGRESFGAYSQDHMPILKQPTIEGHAVRATLLTAGLAAAAYENEREDYVAASKRLWDDMVCRKMHITGGIGAYAWEEKFGDDYELPNDAYLETCAAVSAGFYHRNMHLLTGEARPIDELERALINGVLPGVSLDGTRYFYVNPLEAGASHRRWNWHGCPCCPPMFLKIVAALPGYIYSQDENGIYLNLFLSNTAKFVHKEAKIEITVETQYPWIGGLKVSVSPAKPVKMAIGIRKPHWSEEGSYLVNGQTICPEIKSGYAVIDREWRAGDTLEYRFDLKPVLVQSNPKVKANRGLNAIAHGPVVYCLESIDNGGDVRSLCVPSHAELRSSFDSQTLGGVVRIETDGLRVMEEDWSYNLYKPAAEHRAIERTAIQAVPYYANANREPGDMRVWIPSTPDRTNPLPLPTLASEAGISVSYHLERDPVSALNDRIEPHASDDATIARMTWWPHKGNEEWAQYTFPEPAKLIGVDVYWWDEARTGAGCRVPDSWRIEWLDGEEWKPVQSPSAYGIDVDKFNRCVFEPIETTAIRLAVKMQERFSAGILEWRVF